MASGGLREDLRQAVTDARVGRVYMAFGGHKEVGARNVALIDPPFGIGDGETSLVGAGCHDNRIGDQARKAAGPDRRRPCDLPVAADKLRQIEMGDGRPVTCSSLRLLFLLVGDKAGPALGRLQPAGFAILLANKAVEIVDLLAAAGVSDALFHVADDAPPRLRGNRDESG